MMSGEDERKRLMKVKKRMSQKKPDFRKFESWRLDRIKDHWRRPRGIDNKMRQERKGWPKVVKIGYRSPKAVRGFHPSGMEEVAVYNVGDLTIVDPENQVARIGGTVGTRKKKTILKEAEKLGIKILNPGDIELEEEEEYPEDELEGEEPEEEAEVTSSEEPEEEEAEQ
jgi:large subunit ribosomal protein L32e